MSLSGRQLSLVEPLHFVNPSRCYVRNISNAERHWDISHAARWRSLWNISQHQVSGSASRNQRARALKAFYRENCLVEEAEISVPCTGSRHPESVVKRMRNVILFMMSFLSFFKTVQTTVTEELSNLHCPYCTATHLRGKRPTRWSAWRRMTLLAQLSLLTTPPSNVSSARSGPRRWRSLISWQLRLKGMTVKSLTWRCDAVDLL